MKANSCVVCEFVCAPGILVGDPSTDRQTPVCPEKGQASKFRQRFELSLVRITNNAKIFIRFQTELETEVEGLVNQRYHCLGGMCK